jgi:hypothetical protein
MNSASLCNLAGRYDNPLPPWFLAPIDSLKIPAREWSGMAGVREDWMIYRGPGFLAIVLFSSMPNPSPPSLVIMLSIFLSLPMCCRSRLLAGKGGEGGRGAESYDRKKAWSSIINRSILSGRGRRQNEIKAESLLGSVGISFCLWSRGKSQRRRGKKERGQGLGCAVKCKYKRLWSNIFSLLR